MSAVIDFLVGTVPVMVGIGIFEGAMYALGFRRKWERR